MGGDDRYVNQAYLSVTESAANTLTFSKLETGINIYEKVGWLISRFDYNFDVTAANFSAEGDAVYFGLSVSAQITNINLIQDAVIDFNSVIRHDYGTAGNAIIQENPHSKSFADLPGGGLLIPPNPLYIYVKGANLASPVIVTGRMFYTVIKLKTEDFWELVEQRRMIGT